MTDRKIRKMEFVFDGVTMSLSETDIEAVCQSWYDQNPGREMTSIEFADACMAKIKASARPNRTILHS